MTIMLLPNDQILVLGQRRLSFDDAKRIIDMMEDFLVNGRRVGVMSDIAMIIDARTIPAIKIEL